MTLFVLYALAGGALVGLSRQINGRLALSTSALAASFWNHAVGLLVLVVLGVATASLWPDGVAAAPWWAWAGGPVGVVFIAAGSWLVARIGAAETALLVIGGQMVTGVVLDLMRGTGGDALPRAAGVALILAGMAVTARRR